MRFWLIALWRTIPRRWIVVSIPVVLPLFLLVLWWLFGGLFYTPPDARQKAAMAELKSIVPRAQGGDHSLQYRAGVILRDGLTGKADPAEAAKWFELAAKQGDIGAEVALGDMYAKGTGVRQNYSRAAEFYGAAARGGRNPEAEFHLGELYFFGRGFPQDSTAAVDWFRKAALDGHAGAQSVMGSMYEQGFGVDKSPVDAFVWYTLAAERAPQAIAARSDIDPREAVARLKPTLSRNDSLKAERLLAETRKKVRKN